MCKSALHPLLVKLPKCEHHMHLEGSLSPSLLFALAARNSITLPTTDPAFHSPDSLHDRYTRFTSLDDFLHYYFIGMSCLVHEHDFEELAWEYFIKAKSDAVVHAEVFFDPEAHTGRGVPYRTVVDGFKKACRRAEEDLGISTRLILCFLRHLPVDVSATTFSQAEDDLQNGVLAGIGLDSTEKGNPPGNWKELYSVAKDRNVRRTAHAGEEGPVEYIRGALRDLDVERVDHGIRLVDDKQLMNEVAMREILITMCPLSNGRLRCVENVEQLPIRTFLDAGVPFSINSDDPAYFGGYILDNYCAVQEAFDLTIQDWERIGWASINGCWISASEKQRLQNHLQEVIQENKAH